SSASAGTTMASGTGTPAWRSCAQWNALPPTRGSSSGLMSSSRANEATSLRRQHPLARFAEAVDPERDDVTRTPVDGRRLPAHADAGRRAGADHIARQQRHELADVADERRHVEDHVGGVAVLPRFAVDAQPEPQPLRIGNLVARHDERTERGERIGA